MRNQGFIILSFPSLNDTLLLIWFARCLLLWLKLWWCDFRIFGKLISSFYCISVCSLAIPLLSRFARWKLLGFESGRVYIFYSFVDKLRWVRYYLSSFDLEGKIFSYIETNKLSFYSSFYSSLSLSVIMNCLISIMLSRLRSPVLPLRLATSFLIERTHYMNQSFS